MGGAQEGLLLCMQETFLGGGICILRRICQQEKRENLEHLETWKSLKSGKATKRCTKRYVCNVLSTCCTPDVTYTMVWLPMGARTLVCVMFSEPYASRPLYL